MKKLFGPAIVLMNRCSYGMKFGLISVLFLLPLIVVSGMLVSQSQQRLEASEHTLHSIALVREQLEIVRLAQKLRDIDTIYSQIAESRAGKAVGERSKDLRGDLVEHLKALQVRDDVSGADDLLKQRDVLLAIYQGTGEPLSNDRVHASTQAYWQALLLLRFGISYAGITQDYDFAVREAGNVLSHSIPDVTDALGRARSVSSYIVEQGVLSSNASRILDDIVELLPRLGSDYQQALIPLGNFDGFRSIHGQIAPSVSSLEDTQAFLMDRILLSSQVAGDWLATFNPISEQIDVNWMLGDRTLVALQLVLEERVLAGYIAIASLCGILALAICVTVYLYGGFYLATRHSIENFGERMAQVAGGDMTVKVSVDSRDELGSLGNDFNETVARIRKLIEQVSQTSNQVQEQSVHVQSISSQSSQAVAAQRLQIEQVAAAMNQMTATSHEVAQSAASAVQNAQQVNEETSSGRKLVEKSVKDVRSLADEIEASARVIDQLAEDSSSISRVLVVINSVAEQTNLLALNAAIEAARAGEQGRGFAVVADEVRTLASRTQQSTAEIEQMINKIQSGVAAAVKAMRNSHDSAGDMVESSAEVEGALGKIGRGVTQIADHIQQIAAAAEEQTAVSHDIDSNIVEINRAGERSAQGAIQAEESSRGMGQLVRELQAVISTFRV